jgi:hypothetical protein
MASYLVVAHQTATSPELIERARGIAAGDRDARFALLVPATHATHLLHASGSDARFTWDDERTDAVARARADEASERFRRAGLTVERTAVGDASPLLAIEDELRLRPDRYHTILLSTLPAEWSRWLLSGIGSEVERFGLPVVHIGSEPAPPRISLWSRIPRPAFLRRFAEASPRTAMITIATLLVLYLVGDTTLALQIDRTFFLNDAMVLVAFGTMLGGLAYAARRESPR